MAQREPNAFENALEILQDLVVPESDDPESLSLQPVRAPGIGRLLDRVLPAIQFDDESLLEAEEIHVIGSDGNLGSESMPVELLAPKPSPKVALRIGRNFPKLTSSLDAYRAPFFPRPLRA